MKKIFTVFLLLSTCTVLSGCAAYIRETRLIADEKEMKEYVIGKEHLIGNIPLISVTSSCVDDQFGTIGPYIGIPLPIIPNVFLPFQINSLNKKPAFVFVEIEAPPGKINWKESQLNIKFNNLNFSPSRIDDFSSEWKQNKKYFFDLKTSCQYVENQKISIEMKSIFDSFVNEDLYLKTRYNLQQAP